MVRAGVDVVIDIHLSELRGMGIGVLANRASVNADGEFVAYALAAAGADVVALYGPEHGLTLAGAAGEPVKDAVDERLGIPVYSLYGVRGEPTDALLTGVDMVVVDLQDVGARFYTYASTVRAVLAACKRKGIPAWVLDRPNPIGGQMVEGPLLCESCVSFVGACSVPVRHGLTMGELALLLNLDIGCELRVVRVSGWRRAMWFDGTGLSWVPPSPNMRDLHTAMLYPGTCLLEGTNLSEGRGTARPFELFGAPWIDAESVLNELESLELPGVGYEPVSFTPSSSKYVDENCFGIKLTVLRRSEFLPCLTGVAIICAVRQVHPDRFAFRAPMRDGRWFFDLLMGNPKVRNAVDDGKTPAKIAELWREDESRFLGTVGKYLLYE